MSLWSVSGCTSRGCTSSREFVFSCATGDGTFGWSNAASLYLIRKSIALVHVELCRVWGRVLILSCNTCGARIIWLCAETNLGLGTHG